MKVQNIGRKKDSNTPLQRKNDWVCCLKRSVFFPSLPLCFSLTKILRKLLPLLVGWSCLSAFPSRPQGRAGDWSDRGHGERHGERAFYLAILPVRKMSFRLQHIAGWRASALAVRDCFAFSSVRMPGGCAGGSEHTAANKNKSEASVWFGLIILRVWSSFISYRWFISFSLGFVWTSWTENEQIINRPTIGN